jgi:hypothetical protein
MSNAWAVTKRILRVMGGLAFFAGLVVLYNIWFWGAEGNPTIPALEKRWWAGYYDTATFGRQWCVARFAPGSGRKIKMALLSAWDEPQVLDVERTSSDSSFAHLTLIDPSVGMRIEAKQLYLGKRYILQRLLVGRFRDFWRQNEDVAIRGSIVSLSPSQEFAIEPIEGPKLQWFWRTYVRPQPDAIGPEELLASVSFPL